MIVADTGPLIVFARIGRLALLQQVVETVIIPDAVYDELITRGRGRPGAQALSQSAWIEHESIGDPGATQHFPNILEQGEREAIGRLYLLGEGWSWNNASNVPLTHASRKCNR